MTSFSNMARILGEAIWRRSLARLPRPCHADFAGEPGAGRLQRDGRNSRNGFGRASDAAVKRWRMPVSRCRSARRRSTKARCRQIRRAVVQPIEHRGGIDPGKGGALCVVAEIGRVVPGGVPDPVDRLVQQPQRERRVLRQCQHRQAAPHRLAPRLTIEAEVDRRRRAATAERSAPGAAAALSSRSSMAVGPLAQRGDHAGAPREQRRRLPDRDADAPRRGAQRRARPAVERHVGQHRLDQRSRSLSASGLLIRFLLGEKGREIDRMALQFLDEDRAAGGRSSAGGRGSRRGDRTRAARPGRESPRPRARSPRRRARPAVADPQMPRHDPAQPGHRKATLPAERALVADRLDNRVDQHRQILLDIAGQIGQPLAATRNTTMRHGMCTCGAAMPVPPASSIVSTMSSTRRRTQGAVGSSTGLAGARNTGCPMRAIFNRAMCRI